jgi:hypothetical protein
MNMLKRVRVRGGWRLFVFFSTLGCVGYVKNFAFGIASKTEHPTRDFYFIAT